LVPAVIEIVDLALRSHFMSPAREPKLTNPEEVREAIRALIVSKAPGPNGISNRAFKHLPQRAVSVVVLICNTVILSHHFPTLWKHARVISIIKLWKDPALPSSYRPIRLLDTIGKLFEKILLARILHDTVWIDGLLYKLTVLNFPSYMVHTILSYLRGRTFDASFQAATSFRRVMRAGVAQGGLISPVLFSL
jgi:hypothetical protein